MCLSSAEMEWRDWGNVLVRRGNECVSSDCVLAVNEAHIKNDKDFQKNKDDCFLEIPYFREFPQ